MDLLDGKILSEILIIYLPYLLMLLVSTALGFLIAWTYRRTHRGFSYSQSFSITVVLITVITSFIIVLIEDSIARAIGIFGAFSIIRFRTAIKDVRDIAFVFFALASGLAIGVGLIGVGLLGTLFICALIFLLHKTNFGGLRKLDFILNFKMDAKNHSEKIFKEVMTKYLKKEVLLNVEAKERGRLLVFTFNVSLKDGDSLKEFVEEMNGLEGVENVSMVSSRSDLEF